MSFILIFAEVDFKSLPCKRRLRNAFLESKLFIRGFALSILRLD